MKHLGGFLVALAMVLQSASIAAEPQVVSAPSEDGYNAANAKAEAFFDLIRLGDAEVAVLSIFSGPPNAIPDDVCEDMIPQLEKILNDHGSMEDCELVMRDHFGSKIINLIYICEQQDGELSKWTLKLKNKRSQWKIIGIAFETGGLNDF